MCNRVVLSFGLRIFKHILFSVVFVMALERVVISLFRAVCHSLCGFNF